MAAAGDGAAAGGGGGAAAAPAPVELKDDGTKVTLLCKDDVKIECPTVIAQQMSYLEAIPKDTAGDEDDDEDEEDGGNAIKGGQTLPVMNVSADLLKLVVEFGTKNLNEAKKSPEEISRPLKTSALTDNGVPEWAVTWLQEAIKGEDGKEDLNRLFDLMNATNELIYNTLTELTCAFTASKLKEMDDKAFYATFGLTRDFTPDEEADVRASNKWVEDA